MAKNGLHTASFDTEKKSYEPDARASEFRR
jgi:hypothetical protein